MTDPSKNPAGCQSERAESAGFPHQQIAPNCLGG
jgi:hypothetical protein